MRVRRLSERLIPTRLVAPLDRPPIQIQPQGNRLRFRMTRMLFRLFRVALTLLYWRLRRQLSGPRAGRILREFCQHGGVLWIKLGQLVSMRADLASPAVRAELAKLQDRVDGFPSEEAVQQIERELQAPLDRYFSEFERVPIAAASVAQVHRARLRREGTWVAVKVRRPAVEALCEIDLSLVRLVVRLFEWARFQPQARWRDMLWELEEALREELDFRFEAANMRRIRRTLRPHGVYVPKVFSAYCTAGVLVMEFVRGVLMSDYLSVSASDPRKAAAWRADNNMKPALVARRMFHSFLRQVFEDNLFHSDLHPGNIVLLRDSRIAFLDFGSLGTMERDFGRKVDLYIEAMSRREYAKMVDIYFLFSDSLPDVDLAECKNHMVRLLQAWGTRTRVSGLPYRQKSFNVIQDELVLFAARFGVSPVWTFFRMTRAMTTMDASLRELIPDAEVPALVAAYYRARGRRTAAALARRALSSPPNLQEWAELPNRAMESTMFAVDIVRRHAAIVEGTTSHFAQFFARIFGNFARGIFVFGLGLLGLALWQHTSSPEATDAAGPWRVLPRLDAQVWLLLLGTLWFVSRRLRQLSQRLVQRGGERPWADV